MKRILSVSFVLVLVFAACKRDNTSEEPSPVALGFQTNELSIPSDFNFETTESITLDMNLEAAPLAGSYLLQVFTERPSVLSEPSFEAFLDGATPLNRTIQVPSSAQFLYIVLQSPDRSSFLTILPKASTVTHTFYRAKFKSEPESNGPSCFSGCDVVRAHSGNWTAHNNFESTQHNGHGNGHGNAYAYGHNHHGNHDHKRVYCVTGTYNGSGSISVTEGAIVRLCGTGNIPNISLHKGVVKVLSGASVTVTNFNIDNVAGNELIIYQGGSLTVTNWFNPHHTVQNHGNLNLAALHLSPRTTINNYGTLHLNSDNLALIEGNLVNHGNVVSSASISVKQGGQLSNYCSITLHKNLLLEGVIGNYSYLKVDDKLTIGGAGEMIFLDGAITHTGSVLVNGRMQGIGSTSMFKIEGRSDAFSTAHIKGNLFICDLDGVENLPASIFSNGAKLECSLYIPTSACNPEGNGIVTIVDTDNDGVADELDAYPNDPNKADDFFYPSENQYGSLAFEDLWPAYGDYDFNDLVVDYRYQLVSNADNSVVEIKLNLVTKAIGGSLHNGLGFQFDFAPSAIASVNGTQIFNSVVTLGSNGAESGQTKATIIAYDDCQKLFTGNTAAFVNTVSANPHLDYDTTRITITLAQPQPPASLGTLPYNPFIFIDQDRGREVHLPGQDPTALADQSLFGTIDDNTSGSNTYKSKDNVPWAIHLVGGYQYPEEQVDLNSAYNFFSAWAQSGGQNFPDWYEDEPGYINEVDLYKK